MQYRPPIYKPQAPEQFIIHALQPNLFDLAYLAECTKQLYETVK